ncbi:hypothetical protein ACFYYL_13920 [Actinomadura geliboluensis]|uniref:hypothetical protein n=1 Tax=Actinomadura geliboluensis TaxID=882440 RepID=UPI0036A13A0C
MGGEHRAVLPAEPAAGTAGEAARPDARSAAPETPDADPLHTGPPSTAAPGAAPPPGPAETRALIRAQLRAALGTCAIVMAVLVGLPLLALVPPVARARAHGLPVLWLVLAAGVQPVWVAVAVLQLKRAERAERALDRR